MRPANAVVAFAPVTDLTMNNPSWRNNIETDAFLGPFIKPLVKLPRWFLACATRIPMGRPVNHPELSPLFGNLDHLPPTLIQVSRDEVLYDDAQRYANKANEVGSNVELNVWPTLVHVFQAFEALPESGAALQLAADFLIARP
jgi:acetyl esterase/lipase